MKKRLSDMKAMIKLSLVMTIFLFSAYPSQAHHSFAMYNRTESYIFTGVVTGINPGNVHLEIFFAVMNDARDNVVRDEDDKPILWSVEMGSAAGVARFGITPTGFTPGTLFSAVLHPEHGGGHGGVLLRDKKNNSVLFRCPGRTTPEPGMHCNSVDGSTSHGAAELLPEENTKPIPFS